MELSLTTTSQKNWNFKLFYMFSKYFGHYQDIPPLIPSHKILTKKKKKKKSNVPDWKQLDISWLSQASQSVPSHFESTWISLVKRNTDNSEKITKNKKHCNTRVSFTKTLLVHWIQFSASVAQDSKHGKRLAPLKNYQSFQVWRWYKVRYCFWIKY